MTSTPSPTEVEHWCSAVSKNLEGVLQGRALASRPGTEEVMESFNRAGWVHVSRVVDLHKAMKPADWVMYDLVRLFGRRGRRWAAMACRLYQRQGCELDSLPLWLRYMQHDVEVSFHVEMVSPLQRIDLRMTVAPASQA